MSTFSKEFDGLADAIITNAIVTDAVDIDTNSFPSYFYIEKAAWDTGAQMSCISARVVNSLGLSPSNSGTIFGIGGNQQTSTYIVHIGLPTGDIIQNLEVFCSDIDDYDLLIGMDIIALTDFHITNENNNTKVVINIPTAV